MWETILSQTKEVSSLILSLCLAVLALIVLILILRKKDHLEINVLGYHVVRIDRISNDNPTPQESAKTPVTEE